METYNKWDGADKHHYRRANEQNDHLDLCTGQTPEAASPSPRVHAPPEVVPEWHPAHEAPVHPNQGDAHQHVADDGGEDEDGAEPGVHVGVSGVAALVAPPLQKAPSLRVLFLHLSEPDDRQRAKERVGDVDREERQAGQLLINVVIVEIGMVDSDVSFHRHGTDDAESRQGKEQQGKSEVLAQRVLPGPRPLHVGGDGDRAGQEGPKEVCDRQTTHQRVKSGFLLFLTRFTKNHDGDEVANHPENEHNGRDGGDHGPPCHRLIIHD